MSIPENCTVLVVGGGPAGSYAAAALAREGIETVLLEADVFPRYHVGESMLPSLRHFLKFIDLDETFDKHGFQQKRGAAFKLNGNLPVAYTDFIEAGGPDAHAWNVVRSESDHLMFKHAEKSGAKTFDGTKVQAFEFDPVDASQDAELPSIGRATSASWSCKDGRSGTIKFQYLIDASGRAGVLSTKYLKSRKYNAGLKNVASWGYWKNVGNFGVGTKMEGQPYFVAIEDGSGWIWTIRLHNGTTSVGVVQNQEISTERKKEMGLSGRDYYTYMVQNTPGVAELCKDAELVTDIKYASDWSYSSSHYATANTRIAGDAGCFIDPYFSSGVHLAVSSGLSAVTTICAAIRGDCDEAAAAKWHTAKVSMGYTRFLLVVMSALKQITKKEELVLGDVDEESFDRAFALFRPIIQGTTEVSTKLTQAEITQTVDFCCQAFHPAGAEEREAVAQKLSGASMPEMSLSDEERRVLTTMRARNAIRSDDLVNIDNFRADVVNGMIMNLTRGKLGLDPAPVPALHSGESGMNTAAAPVKDPRVSVFSY